MNLNTVFYKIFFSAIDRKKKNFFRSLCNLLFCFSDINEPHTKIKGLTLNGFHYYRNIHHSQINEISEKEIAKIDRITPIVDMDFFPFIFDRDCLEIRNSSHSKNIEDLIVTNENIDYKLKKWINSNHPKKIIKNLETHLRYPFVKSCFIDFNKNTAKKLPPGPYIYKLKTNNYDKKYEIEIPEYIDKLKNIEAFFDIKFLQRGKTNNNKDIYNIKLINKKSKCIIKQLSEDFIGLSFYSNDVKWFNCVLQNHIDKQLPKHSSKIPYTSLPCLS